jgi:hypothetical protein
MKDMNFQIQEAPLVSSERIKRNPISIHCVETQEPMSKKNILKATIEIRPPDFHFFVRSLL